MDETSENNPLETPENVLIPEVVEDAPGEGAGDAPPEETGDLIEDAVRFINYTIRKMLSDYALKIGNYLLTRFFDDDMDLAVSKNR